MVELCTLRYAMLFFKVLESVYLFAKNYMNLKGKNINIMKETFRVCLHSVMLAALNFDTSSFKSTQIKVGFCFVLTTTTNIDWSTFKCTVPMMYITYVNDTRALKKLYIARKYT